MSYGLMFQNNNGATVLDSEYSRLVVTEKGRFTSVNSLVQLFFTKTYTTQEPPLIFARMDNTGRPMACSWVQVAGSAGAWTGVQFRGLNISGDYFIAVFAAVAVASYGLGIWDATGKLIFNSGNPCAQFVKSVNQWTYIGSQDTSPGFNSQIFQAPYDLYSKNYMLINNMGMSVCGSNARGRNIGVSWDWANNRLYASSYGALITSVNTFNVPAVFAKIDNS